MIFVLCLQLLAYMVWPFLVFCYRERLPAKTLLRFSGRAAIFFAIHNCCYCLGLSIRGDGFDYLVFNLEYMLVVLVVFVGLRGIRWLSWLRDILCILIFVIIAITPVMLPFYYMGLRPDRSYRYGTDLQYESRYCEYGTANTSGGFTMDTYRDFKYLPVEQLLDEHNFTEREAKPLPEDAKFYVVGNTLYIDDGRQILQRKL